MGQYYLVVNLDKKQYLKPHDCDDGAKLMELSNSVVCLAILLSNGNGRGGGSCRSTSKVIGSWAGDRIVVAGDYGDDGKWVPEGVFDEDGNAPNLYGYARAHFENISGQAMQALAEDEAA